MSSDGARHLGPSAGAEKSWPPRQFAQALVSGEDGFRQRRPTTGGKALLPNLPLANADRFKRPSTAGTARPSSMLFSGSLSNAGRFGFRRADQKQLALADIGSANLGADRGLVGLQQSSRDSHVAQLEPWSAARVHPDSQSAVENPGAEKDDGEASNDANDGDLVDGEPVVEDVVEVLRGSIAAMQSLPDRVASSLQSYEEMLSRKDKEIAALTASNEELDADIERATVSIDEFEKQERDTRERYAELEHEMLTLETELTSMKAQRDEFESVHDQEVTRHRMHVVECDTATLRLQNAVEEQIAIVAGKDAKIKDVSEELVYVQRQIEHQVDQLRASEKEKLKQSSRLQDAEANRKDLDLQLSQVTKAQSTLAELFESEKLASNSTISNLRQGLADRDEQILMSTSQMQMARREIAEHVQDNSRLMVRLDGLVQNTNTVKISLSEAQKHSSNVRTVTATVQKRVLEYDRGLKCSLRNLRDVSWRLESVLAKSNLCAEGAQTLATMLVESNSKHCHDNSNITQLKEDALILRRDQELFVSDVRDSVRANFVNATKTLSRTFESIDSANDESLGRTTQAVIQLKSGFQTRIVLIAREWIQSVINIAESFMKHKEEQCEKHKATEVFVAGKLSDLEYALQTTIESLCDERLQLAETRIACDLDAGTNKVEVARLQGLLSEALLAKDQLREERDCLSANSKAAASALSAAERTCVDLGLSCDAAQESTATLAVEVKKATSISQNLETRCLKLEKSVQSKDVELTCSVARAEAAETALSRLQAVCNDLELREKATNEMTMGHEENLRRKDQELTSSISRAEHAEVVLARLQADCATLGVKAKAQEDATRTSEEKYRTKEREVATMISRAEAAEAAHIDLKGVCNNLEVKLKAKEDLAMVEESVELSKLRDENASLSEELRRGKSLVAETETNLRESAQLTLNAVSEKEQLNRELFTCRAALSHEKNETAKLAAECGALAKNTCVGGCQQVDPDALLSAVQEQRRELEDAALSDSLMNPVDCASTPLPVKIVEEALAQQCATRYPSESIAQDIEIEGHRGQRSNHTSEKVTKGPGKDPTAVADLEVAVEAAKTRRSLRKKKECSPQQLLASTPDAAKASGKGKSKATDMKLTLAPRKPKRAGFKRPRAKMDSQEPTIDSKFDASVKHRVKKSKKAAASVTAAAARFGMDDEDDWMVG